jgi:hypothetical protein
LWDKSQAIPLPSGNFGDIELTCKDQILSNLKVIRTVVDEISSIQLVQPNLTAPEVKSGSSEIKKRFLPRNLSYLIELFS